MSENERPAGAEEAPPMDAKREAELRKKLAEKIRQAEASDDARVVDRPSLTGAAWAVVNGWQDNMTEIEKFSPLIRALHTALVWRDDAGVVLNEREQECSTDPRAPHGFDRNGSHSAGRYVCECEGWVPPVEPPKMDVQPFKWIDARKLLPQDGDQVVYCSLSGIPHGGRFLANYTDPKSLRVLGPTFMEPGGSMCASVVAVWAPLPAPSAARLQAAMDSAPDEHNP